MPFNAADAEIVSLDYDFRPYVNASGITPEPTEEMILQFQEDTKNIARLLGREGEVDFNDPKSSIRFMRKMTKEDRKKSNDAFLKALSKMTQGRPSYEQLKELNEKAYRHCQAYQASIISDILNPKGLNIGTNE